MNTNYGPSAAPQTQKQSQNMPDPTPIAEPKLPAPTASQEPPPMLDVHPPHETPHSWRDFFIHIATITVGLLIALGLEQTVEYFHHRHEGSELREDLHRESEQITKDSSDTDIGQTYQMNWLGDRIRQLQETVWNHKPLGPAAPYALPNYFYPNDPIWRSAKTSGKVVRLNQNEIDAFSEIEFLIGKIDAASEGWRAAQARRLEFESQFPTIVGVTDFSPASHDDMRTELSLLTAELNTSNTFRIWNRCLAGAEGSILKGNIQQKQIAIAEYKACDPKPADPTRKTTTLTPAP
jgi:hypothetical protein